MQAPPTIGDMDVAAGGAPATHGHAAPVALPTNNSGAPKGAGPWIAGMLPWIAEYTSLISVYPAMGPDEPMHFRIDYRETANEAERTFLGQQREKNANLYHITRLCRLMFKHLGSNRKLEDWNSVRRNLTTDKYWTSKGRGGHKHGDRGLDFIECVPGTFQRHFSALVSFVSTAAGRKGLTGHELLEQARREWSAECEPFQFGGGHEAASGISLPPPGSDAATGGDVTDATGMDLLARISGQSEEARLSEAGWSHPPPSSTGGGSMLGGRLSGSDDGVQRGSQGPFSGKPLLPPSPAHGSLGAGSEAGGSMGGGQMVMEASSVGQWVVAPGPDYGGAQQQQPPPPPSPHHHQQPHPHMQPSRSSDPWRTSGGGGHGAAAHGAPAVMVPPPSDGMGMDMGGWRPPSQRESTNSLDDMMVDEANPSGSTSRWMYGAGASTGSTDSMYYDQRA